MSTDFRALCAELHQCLEYIDRTCDVPISATLLDRARTALAQPEPEGAAPTDEELWELYELERGEPGDWSWVRDYARTALARWGAPAIPPVPSKVQP
jgi:hypothetical protein